MFLLLLAAACEPIPVQSIDDIDFPEGLVLDTSRGVSVGVTGVSSTDTRRVTFWRADGSEAFVGPARILAAYDVQLALPYDQRWVEISVDGGPRTRLEVHSDTVEVPTTLLGGAS